MIGLVIGLFVGGDRLEGVVGGEDPFELVENDGVFDLGKEIRVLARNKDKLTPEDKREIIELLVDL